MKKQIISTLAWVAVAIVIAGCAHTTETAAKKSPVQEVVILIAQDGTGTVAGEKCATAQLAAKLSGLGARNAMVQVDDAGATRTQVTAVMDACKAAVVEQVYGIVNHK
jgi:biopolymer transport protein ExbD